MNDRLGYVCGGATMLGLMGACAPFSAAAEGQDRDVQRAPIGHLCLMFWVRWQQRLTSSCGPHDWGRECAGDAADPVH
ncbi:hypothetical protein DMENIID0001_027750 [Sergentomyia squamirostris]